MNKNTPQSVSNTNDSDSLEGGRTVVFRDAIGELVLSSTYEEDTLERMFKIAMSRGMIAINQNPPGPRQYHG